MEQLISMGLGEWQERSGSQTFVAKGRFPD
jgi:hypothetical protein